LKTKNSLCKILEWDSNHFNKKIGIIRENSILSSKQFSLIDSWCIKNNIDCLYYKRNFNPDTNLEKNNKFIHYDIRVELNKKINSNSIKKNDFNNDIILKELTGESIGSLNTDLLKRFIHSRFNKDKRFNQNLVSKMYEIWIENHIHSENSTVLGAFHNNKNIGVISFEISINRTHQIGLFTVSENFEKSGVGTLLLNSCVNKVIQANGNQISVVTQQANKEGFGFYLKHGFEIVSSYDWFHKWYN